MTTDAAIAEQLRAAWNRSAETPPTEEPDGTSTGESRSDRQNSDRLVSETLDRINAACPPDWKPTAEDWQRIDGAEGAIDRARRENDRPELLLTCFDRYGHRSAWRSVHGPHWICADCHPPATPDIVAETAELDVDGQIAG